MKGVVIAAGRGGRLSDLGEPKPLVPVCGRPLIRHVLERATAAGLDEMLVVTGHMFEALEAYLGEIARERGIKVRSIRNPIWEEGQHTSVRAAAPYLDGPFALMMSDHLFDWSILSDLLNEPLGNDALMLAVDRRLDNPLVDLDDVTRVTCNGDRIVGIGKNMADYNAFDTGLFLCTPELFDALERTGVETPGLSDGVRLLAREGRAGAVDIGDRFWIDVDDHRMHALAERALEEA